MNDSTHIIVSMIGFLGIVVTAFLSYLTHRHTREINDAVNHRHERGPDALKLYDLALDNHATTRVLEQQNKALAKQGNELIEWKRSYENGPLDTGSKVGEFVELVEDHMTETKERLDRLEGGTTSGT